MSKKKPRAGFDLADIDTKAMRGLQDDLGRHTRLLAELGSFDQIAKQFRQFEDLQWSTLQPLESKFAATLATQDWVEREKQLMAQLSGLGDMLQPHLEAAALATAGFRDMQEAINAITHPFETLTMANMLGQLSPTIQAEDYLALFDFQRLHTYIENFDLENNIEDLEGSAEVESDDCVHFEANPQIQSISAISDALIQYFANHPEEMRKMPPRRFEELIAELVGAFGFDVEMTQATRDGGRDVIAVKHDLFRTRHLIECKRYAEGNPVRVHEVRSLFGVLCSERASNGVMVTTSYLTADARKFVETNRWQLDSKEFGALKQWILAYLKRKSTNGPEPPGLMS